MSGGDSRLRAPAAGHLAAGLGRRLVGLDVLCGDGARRILPFPACDVVEKHIAVDSALVFLERDVDFYRVGVVGNLDLRSAV